ncbi:DNA cytosine methyltransferase [Erysipelothrix rhusiopathiae]|uniref:DNA cytosine methyltransferase n=1 Tax=Erysipelothrix rhusiopathiae TaxID=1648 RepID=UPI00202AF81E|nr:DNA cytosine methyltransferase [Erysipelothrix rhusiopathiae]URQ77346.1 DNA cytosine methyltransferase [Erysipelothrix rhusiopathiae]
MYNVIDLFAGVGGLTFGFEYEKENNAFIKRHDFSNKFAVDFNEDASLAFKLNYPTVPIFNLDIKTLTRKMINNKLDGAGVDIIVGGPPCQSFSMIGKRINDDRSKLYTEYKRILKIVKPRVFVFENVKGILTMKDETKKNLILPGIIEDFEKVGYNVTYNTLNSASFGVPQLRERVFIVGVRNDIELQYNFPTPTVDQENYLTLRNAISDLPELGNGESTDLYTIPPQSDYERLMRGTSTILTNHSNGKKTNLMLEIFDVLGEGESKVNINEKVEQKLIPEHLKRTSGYGNTYGRLWWDRPGMTITNKINCPSSLRCIHPTQNRALTPREGARIQSFPDWFNFHGSMTEVMTQIGNAVPPLLSIAIADSILNFLREVDKYDAE